MKRKSDGIDLVSAPAASSAVVTSKRPVVNGSSRKGVTRINHRELVRSGLKGAVDFNVVASWAGQPGLLESFPWLALTARNFDQYVIHKMSALWVPSAPTDTPGKVTIAPDYDALDPPPNSSIAVANYAQAKTFPVWHTVEIPLDVKALMGLGPRRFIRTGKVLNSDLKTYDTCNIFVCTQNFNDDEHTAGDLFIDYDIEFFSPEVPLGGIVATKRSYTDIFTLPSIPTLSVAVHAEPLDTFQPCADGTTSDLAALVQANNWEISADAVTLTCLLAGWYHIFRTSECVTSALTSGIGTFVNFIEAWASATNPVNVPFQNAYVVEDAFGVNGAQYVNTQDSYRYFAVGETVQTFAQVTQNNGTATGTLNLVNRRLLFELLA
jgi:hypothetical protein